MPDAVVVGWREAEIGRIVMSPWGGLVVSGRRGAGQPEAQSFPSVLSSVLTAQGPGTRSGRSLASEAASAMPDAMLVGAAPAVAATCGPCRDLSSGGFCALV